MKIGFVGLGAMGVPMAVNLLKAGYDVQGFDLSPKARDAFVGLGGKAFESVAAAVTGADAIIVMVVNAAQAEDVLFNQGGLEGLNPDACVIVCATCAPESIEKMAKRVHETQRQFIDAPVSGGVVGAQAGSLTIMAACAQNVFQEHHKLLTKLGSRLYHVGLTPGQGAMVKVINQLLCGVHIVAAAEALSLGEKAGLDASQLLDIFGGSAASSWMLNSRGPRMVQEYPQITSAVDIFVKDLGLVMEAARSAKATVLLAPIAEQLFRAASKQGLGRADDSQIIETYRGL
jgi:L-threonate 2-dehydrogenase